MRPELDASRLTPDQRLREVAAILAAGLLRLHRRAATPADQFPSSPSENPAPASTEPLAGTAETSVTVHGG